MLQKLQNYKPNSSILFFQLFLYFNANFCDSSSRLLVPSKECTMSSFMFKQTSMMLTAYFKYRKIAVLESSAMEVGKMTLHYSLFANFPIISRFKEIVIHKERIKVFFQLFT